MTSPGSPITVFDVEETIVSRGHILPPAMIHKCDIQRSLVGEGSALRVGPSALGLHEPCAPAQDFHMALFLPSCHAFPVLADMPSGMQAVFQLCCPSTTYSPFLAWQSFHAAMLVGLQNWTYFHVLLSLHLHVKEQKTSIV